MNDFSTLYKADLARYPHKRVPGWNRLFHYFFRKTRTSKNRWLKNWYHLCFRVISGIHRMEISFSADIGKGLYLPEPFTITVNTNVVIGENAVLGKNVTIGKQNRGKYKGSPVIGDRVTIGDNAVIVGKVRIGSDVRIAPNAYVNRDIPDHSAVSGNPAVISQ